MNELDTSTTPPNGGDAVQNEFANQQVDYITESEEPAMCSGFGQYHTNEADASKPDKKLTPYVGLKWSEILQLVDNPQDVDKKGIYPQWLIASILECRIQQTQTEQGQFWILWADLDKDIKPIKDVEGVVKRIVGNCQYEIYTTASATEDNQKCRILIPLAEMLDGKTWICCQETLNEKLIGGGITPDTVNKKTAQLCYLPNKGGRGDDNFYDNLVQVGMGMFSTLRQPLRAKLKLMGLLSRKKKRKGRKRY